MKMTRVFAATLLICLWPNWAIAQRPLKDACDTSEAIVIGTVAPVLLSRNAPILNLTVERVIKGDVSSGGVLTVTWPGSALSVTVTPENYRGLWFLRQTARGWEIAPIGGPRAPLFASGLAVPPPGPGARVEDARLACTDAVWTALKASTELVDDSLPYRTATETILREARFFALAAPGAAADVRAFTQSPRASLRAMALASRIYDGDPASLIAAAEQIEELAQANEAHNLGPAVASWDGTQPAAVAALGKLADQPPMASAAARALMMIHTREAVPHLGRLLNSRNREAQLLAVRGLSLFVRGIPNLTPERVRQMAYLAGGPIDDRRDAAVAPYVAVTGVAAGREEEYIAAWQRWWETVRTEFGAASK